MLLPAVDLAPDDADACRALADALATYGAALLRCEAISEGTNDAFLDLLEDYFDQDQSALEADTRPEFGFQVGATLEHTERPKCRADADVDCQAIIAALEPDQRPLDLTAEHSGALKAARTR